MCCCPGSANCKSSQLAVAQSHAHCCSRSFWTGASKVTLRDARQGKTSNGCTNPNKFFGHGIRIYSRIYAVYMFARIHILYPLATNQLVGCCELRACSCYAGPYLILSACSLVKASSTLLENCRKKHIQQEKRQVLVVPWTGPCPCSRTKYWQEALRPP